MRWNPAQRAWCLYDFANSAFAVLFSSIFGPWFATYIVGGSEGDLAWGRLLSLSMAAVALLSPFLGGIADHTGLRRRLLVLCTVAGGAAVLAFSAVGPGDVGLGFCLGAFSAVAFELGMVFYNAYLPRLAAIDMQGRLSARGFAVGYMGSLVALGFAVLLIGNDLFRGVWIALALQWLVVGLWACRRLPADVRSNIPLERAALRGVRGTWQTLRRQVVGKPVGRFLLAYFFFMDGVLTVVHFAPVFATRTLAFGRQELIGLVALVQVTALLGAVFAAGPADRWGPKRVIQILLVLWIGVTGLTWFVQSKPMFYVLASIAGLGLGSIQSTARAQMARLIPEGQEAELFGFYALCGKTGAILGPLVFGWISVWRGDQRSAVLSIALFFIAGLLLLARVPRGTMRPTAPEAFP